MYQFLDLEVYTIGDKESFIKISRLIVTHITLKRLN